LWVPVFNLPSSLSADTIRQATSVQKITIYDLRIGQLLSSVSGLRTSDIRHPTSVFGHPTSDIRLRSSDIRHPTSDFGLSSFVFRLRSYDFGHQTSHIPHPTSVFRLPTSVFRLPSSDIRHPTSHIPHPTSVYPQPAFNALQPLHSSPSSGG